MIDLPILWSFRRCPYAMRARLAVLSAGVTVELRETLLKDKPQAFLDTSSSATVPALRLPDQVIDESLDIMIWALQQRDPHGLLEVPSDGWQLIARNDGPFKTALDHTKYAVRFPDLDADVEREKAAEFLRDLNTRLGGQSFLFGERQTIADIAIQPFVRQFANTDFDWFASEPWSDLVAWLERFTESEAFRQIMAKHVPWNEGAEPILFGGI